MAEKSVLSAQTVVLGKILFCYIKIKNKQIIFLTTFIFYLNQL